MSKPQHQKKDTPGEPPCFFIVACEPSADLLGAHLMEALSRHLNGQVRFAGVGGDLMQAQGFKSLFPISELSHMGIFELLRHIPNILRRLGETARAALAAKPAAVITIDGPDFNFRLAKKLKSRKIPLIHYVAPTVWAWREGRARKIAKLYDHLLTLLPFEPPYFTREGLSATYVGHAAIEGGAANASAARFRQLVHIPEDKKILALLPGSRAGEIGRFAPLFGEVLKRLQPRIGDFTVVVPTLPHLYNVLSPHLARWPIKPVVVMDYGQKYDACAASHAALAASGTVTLELALTNTPNVTTYKVNMLTALVAAAMIRTRFINLVNILTKRHAVPELVQLECTADKLADAMVELWTDDSARALQRQAFTEVRKIIRPTKTDTPSDMAARVICKVVEKASHARRAA